MAKSKPRETAIINVPVKLHERFVAFCEGKKPFPWPIGSTAALALEAYMEQAENRKAKKGTVLDVKA